MLGIQAVCMAAFATYCVRWLAGHGIEGCVLAVVFFALCLPVPHYVVAQWKDTIFSRSLAYFVLSFIATPLAYSLRYCSALVLIILVFAAVQFYNKREQMIPS